MQVVVFLSPDILSSTFCQEVVEVFQSQNAQEYTMKSDTDVKFSTQLVRSSNVVPIKY